MSSFWQFFDSQMTMCPEGQVTGVVLLADFRYNYGYIRAGFCQAGLSAVFAAVRESLGLYRTNALALGSRQTFQLPIFIF